MEGDRGSYSTSSRNWQRGSYRTRSGRRRKRRRKSWGERIADWTRALIAFLFSNVGIVCLVVGYTIAGAFLFTHIEGRNNLDVVGDVIRLRNLTAAILWELTSRENVFSERIWKAKVKAILEDYQKKLVTAIKNGYDGSEENKRWSFAGAFLYSLTVITTIGYGNICPKTKWGKVVTIVYAIIGLPLFLLYLSNIGDILAKSFKWAYARCCLCKCRRRPLETTPRGSVQDANDVRRNHWQFVDVDGREIDSFDMDKEISTEGQVAGSSESGSDDDSSSYDPQRVTVPLTLCVAIMIGYISGGAILFSEWEDWNMLDGSYFCFVSLSTIGFGDIVPGDKIYSAQGFDLSFIFCSMYLMLGMALIAMCFNLMQEEVIAKVRSVVRTVKYIFRCDR
ncbi:TWiK family of potassium channels protein 18-like isoform X3 [Ceratina calcarata]|uniref:TWiK family of potassium channels protein 18-like isoform X3 n=1 Tax=Ceratina calcarata TaxID=156304 RepID=A0AAJ7SCC4_9HYME|nr:TWiK family of potassium channels protein 18-like isoform X3 [Ceratina calcarata]